MENTITCWECGVTEMPFIAEICDECLEKETSLPFFTELINKMVGEQDKDNEQE